jgi:hypothetical protein
VGPFLLVDLTVDDLVAYNVHVMTTAQANKKQLRLFRLLLVPMLLITLALVLDAAVRGSTPEVVLNVVLSLAFGVMIIFLPRYVASTVPRRVRKVISMGLASVPTPVRMWVDDHGGVVAELRDRTTWYTPAAIDRIEEAADHVYLITGPGQAMIIPRRIGEPAVQAFVQALRWHRAQRGIT